MKGTEKKEDESQQDFGRMFKYQNIASETYSVLENLINSCPDDGLIVTVYGAYFMGVVNGKREERRRKKRECLIHK